MFGFIFRSNLLEVGIGVRRLMGVGMVRPVRLDAVETQIQHLPSSLGNPALHRSVLVSLLDVTRLEYCRPVYIVETI